MELSGKVADAVLSPVLNFAAQQTTYPFKVGDNVRTLESATRRLLTKKDDVKEKIKIAERNGQRTTHQLQGWLDEVDATKLQVDAVVEKYEQRCMCFKCFSPDCCSNYFLSKTAAEKLRDVQRLLNDERAVEIAITPVPPPVQEVPVLATLMSSIRDPDPNLEKVLRYIREDRKVGMIGVWGMGGVGKTRLLKQINNSFVGDSSFDHVIFVTASQSCTPAKIQKQIIKSLKLQQEEDVSSQRNIIFDFLKKRNFLLLLDDLWERLDLQEVGIPSPLGVVGGYKRKAVLTTRSITVCGQMEVRKDIKLECLKYDDALNLFLEKVGEETINSNPRLQRLAEDIVKELAGLPLALITIGRAMYQKKDPREWENAIDQLKKSRFHAVEYSHGDHGESTFYRLKFSYDSLNSNTLRECFLSCSMWPDDEDIYKDELIECWMGLGLLEEFDNMSKAYNTGHTLIGELIGACLLEEDEEDDSLVSVHDLLHDMALWIACDNGEKKNKWVVLEGEVPRGREIWREAERMSLMYSDIEKLPAAGHHPSKLTTLMLRSNNDLRELGDMRAFVALTYLNLSDCGFVDFPVEVCGLVQLRYLNLTDNDGISSLPSELGSLVNLKFLILRDTNIRIIPQGVIAKLKLLQVLDIYKATQTDDEILTYLPSPLLEELESLNDLKGLGICVQGISQLHRVIELANMSIWCLAISRLEESTSFSLPESFLGDEQIQMNLADLHIMNCDVTQYMVIECDHRQPAWQLRALENLRFDKMRCLEEIIWKGVVPKELFQVLRFLDIDSCDMLKNISWILHLPCLRDLRVYKCSRMSQLIASEADDNSIPTFPCLTDIELNSLPELVSVCHPAFAFPALSSIEIWSCPKLKKLPFRSSNIPSKLQSIRGEKEWLDGLEWEDNSVKTYLQRFYEEKDEEDTSTESEEETSTESEEA
ncbi:probable disease resistance protein At1g61300 [Typha latifolia]|uniref:probable disease resistance protein At1g61300 n=1 Tax=Typha latifolia TaxID=4733 RepID=UPI003C2C4C6E